MADIHARKGRIPATVVTGFLGAGKTTLIRHLIENAGGRRIALIINEFGDVGVDGEILKSCGVESCGKGDIIELANGCICCTVADDFLPTMQALIDRDVPPDHIVIETSGLALPKPLVQAFNWPEVRKALHDIGYNGYMTTEISGGDKAYLTDVVARIDRFLAGQPPVATTAPSA